LVPWSPRCCCLHSKIPRSRDPDVTENHTALDIVPLSFAFYRPVPCTPCLCRYSCFPSLIQPDICLCCPWTHPAPSFLDRTITKTVHILFSQTHAELSRDGCDTYSTLSSCGSRERQRSVACYPSQTESRKPSRTPRHSSSDRDACLMPSVR
jgi:hypothetical protein